MSIDEYLKKASGVSKATDAARDRERKAERERWDKLYRGAAEDALDALRKREKDLIGLGADTLKDFLGFWSRGDREGAINYLRTTATAGEVIESMAMGTVELRADTVQRRKREEALIALGLDLGHVGAKLLLGMLFLA